MVKFGGLSLLVLSLGTGLSLLWVYRTSILNIIEVRTINIEAVGVNDSNRSLNEAIVQYLRLALAESRYYILQPGVFKENNENQNTYYRLQVFWEATIGEPFISIRLFKRDRPIKSHRFPWIGSLDNLPNRVFRPLGLHTQVFNPFLFIEKDFSRYVESLKDKKKNVKGVELLSILNRINQANTNHNMMRSIELLKRYQEHLEHKNLAGTVLYLNTQIEQVKVKQELGRAHRALALLQNALQIVKNEPERFKLQKALLLSIRSQLQLDIQAESVSYNELVKDLEEANVIYQQMMLFSSMYYIEHKLRYFNVALKYDKLSNAKSELNQAEKFAKLYFSDNLRLLARIEIARGKLAAYVKQPRAAISHYKKAYDIFKNSSLMYTWVHLDLARRIADATFQFSPCISMLYSKKAKSIAKRINSNELAELLKKFRTAKRACYGR